MEQNYFVYKLFNSDCTEFYIGSTKNMKKRKYDHKSHCNNVNDPKYHYKVYEYIRSNGGYSSWSYEILEHIRNSINVVELRNVERKYIEQLKPSLNIEIPNRTRKEYKKQYWENNKEQLKEYGKHYRQDNKEQLNEYCKQHYQNNKERLKEKFNCPCGGKYTTAGKLTHFKTRKHQNYINQ